MISGLSWISTAQYYRRVNEITQDRVGGVTSARIALESVNRQVYVDAVIERGDEETACAQVKQAARDVQSAGADFIVITCNGAHRFMPELRNGTDIPFLHIAQVTADAIKAQGLKRVALLGVRETMEGSYYQDVLEPMGIETVVPNDEERVHPRHDLQRAQTQSLHARNAGRISPHYL
ncbi:MAG: amino acid racemase [Pseudomonadota bacterium]